MSKFYPVKGQHFYMVNSRFEIQRATNNGSAKAKARIDAGNAFKNHSEVLRFQQGILGLSTQVHKRWWQIWK